MLKRRKIIIIDGYNVLRTGDRYAKLAGQAPNFKDWTDEIWNAAREALLNDVLQIIEKTDQAFIIYDAAKRIAHEEESLETKIKNVEIIFTGKDETADARIQKLSHTFREKGMEVQIVSSDLGIQDATMHTGVTRTSSREFSNNAQENIEESKIQTISSNSKQAEMRSKIEDIVDNEVAEKLRQLRDSL